MDGLAALVKEQLQADPFSGVIFCFRAKRADRVKLIFWYSTGLCLSAKRLEGGKFQRFRLIHFTAGYCTTSGVGTRRARTRPIQTLGQPRQLPPHLNGKVERTPARRSRGIPKNHQDRNAGHRVAASLPWRRDAD